jgi:hypothetical protein
MTLVLSCLTERFVLQVSDRRLTNVVSGQAIRGEFNKAVFFTNRMAFAYTGIARLEGRDTDEWLADALSSGDEENECLLAVRDRATLALRRLRLPLALKALAFVGVGWDEHPGSDRWMPWICWISNALDASGRWRLPPRDEFSIHSSVLTHRKHERPVVLSEVGQRLTQDERVQLMRDLRRYADHRVGPGVFADRLVEQVRGVAARTPTVSQELMVAAIPLLPEKFESGELQALSARPTLDSQSFSYVPAFGPPKIELGPRAAFPGGGQMFDFSSRQLDAPGDVEVIVGFRTPRKLP